MCLQSRTSISRNVAADNNAKRVNGGDETAAEFFVMVFMSKTIQPIERNTTTHQRVSFRYDHSLNLLERPRQKLLMHSYLYSTFTAIQRIERRLSQHRQKGLSNVPQAILHRAFSR